ncbi:hypothetical protein BDY21DRAFT_354755 [Lineolata rhizophorae]|uniref:DUF6590 domain-containing protein n=1 Tax=Lineolata rhizophorae TaxID=578093 RepID=A0A6A6NRS9_9PEZI|nr:hypothetical protein BDY21DRAFT_354755 [Lineolata rhizophorae]
MTNPGGWIWDSGCQRSYRIVADSEGNATIDWAPPQCSPQVTQGQSAQDTHATQEPRTPTSHGAFSSPSPGFDPAPLAYNARTCASSRRLSRAPHPYLPSAQSVSSPDNQNPGNRGYRRIGTRDESRDEEFLDHRFRRVRANPTRRFFKFGRVFVMLWSEPAGGNAEDASQSSITTNHMGEPVHSKLRRFVVVSPNDAHCICLPIATYGGQGCSKPGVKVADHAVIFSGDPTTTPPTSLSNEGEFTKRPIRVELGRNVDPEEFALDPMSRINFAKAYTVEHNVKVIGIGVVAEEHHHLLHSYFRSALGFD